MLTDPPYAKEFDYVWDILALFNSCMSDGASLITLCGHYQIPRVIDALRKTLNYHWCCQLPNRNQPIMHGWNIKVSWKPALWFVKGDARAHQLMVDNLQIIGKNLWSFSRDHHKWGQSEEMALSPILNLTKPGDIVLDPFLGSGTTVWCAKKLGRKSIGIEIEEKYCQIAVERLRQSVMDLT